MSFDLGTKYSLTKLKIAPDGVVRPPDPYAIFCSRLGSLIYTNFFSASSHFFPVLFCHLSFAANIFAAISSALRRPLSVHIVSVFGDKNASHQTQKLLVHEHSIYAAVGRCEPRFFPPFASFPGRSIQLVFLLHLGIRDIAQFMRISREQNQLASMCDCATVSNFRVSILI